MTGLVFSKPPHGCEIVCSFFLKDCLSPEITLLSAGLVVFLSRDWGNSLFFSLLFSKRFFTLLLSPILVFSDSVLLDMEDLSKQWTKLSLLDREGDKIMLGKNRESNEYIIAAKFLTRRALNVEAIGRTFKPLWRAINGFIIKNMGNHTLLFIFRNQEDVLRVLNSEPWTFDKHLVVVQKYEKNTPLQDVGFNKTSFWVQVYDIPIRYMTKEVAEEICSSIGEVCHLETHPTEEGGSCVRVRVRVDVSQPLCRGRVVNLEEGDSTWVSFKYERLPIICYWCGRLDHDEKDCSLWIKSKGSLKPPDRQFGPFMRAPLSVNIRKAVVHVSGIYEDRERHQPGTTKARASSSAQSENTPSPDRPGPSPSGTQVGMEVPTMAVSAINADVPSAASRLRNDAEVMADTLDKADFASPSAVLCQPKHSDVSLKEGDSSLAGADLFPMTLNPVLHPEIAGAYAEGDPFLAKLQEIDRDLQKYDQVPREKIEKQGNQPNIQVFQTVVG